MSHTISVRNAESITAEYWLDYYGQWSKDYNLRKRFANDSEAEQYVRDMFGKDFAGFGLFPNYEPLTCKDVPVGYAFKYADVKDSLKQQCEFIKLNGSFNVVNIANWMAAVVDPDEPVELLGKITVR